MSEPMLDIDQATSIADPTLICRVEQFYYREARLLDHRQYQQWLALLTEDIDYRIPGRFIATPDPGLRGTEAYQGIEQELECGGPDGSPIRVENLFTLAIRADRAYKVNAWADNPPARTRRFISNVELFEHEQGLASCNNFMLTYSRHDSVNVTYSGQRRDLLQVDGDSFKLQRRLVIHDWNVLAVPTMGLFF